MLAARSILAVAFYLLGFYFEIVGVNATLFCSLILVFISAIAGGWKQCALLIAIFALGNLRFQAEHHYSKRDVQFNGKDVVIIEPLGIPKISGNDLLLECSISDKQNQSLKVLLRISDISLQNLKPNVIYGTNNLTIKELPYNNNPGVFNYGKYLERRGVEGVGFVKGDNLIEIDGLEGIWPLYLKYRWTLIIDLRNSLENLVSKEILPALLMGYRSGIDKEIKESFTDSGVVHILAVSGLHIGLIYSLMSLLLGLLSFSVFIKKSLILFIIWTFILLSGMPISVIRAGVMLTALVLLKNRAKGFRSTQNLLALMLLFNPEWLIDVGFQLSALAVLGILAFSRKQETSFTGKIRSSLKVSLAAQWSVMPILASVFRVFPTYFLISNLLILPLVTLILYVGIIHWTFSFIGDFYSPLNELIDVLSKLMVTISSYIASLPRSVIQIPLFETRTICMLCLLWCYSTYLFYRTKSTNFASGLTILLLSIVLVQEDMRTEKIFFNQSEKELIVSKRKGRDVISFFTNKKSAAEAKRNLPEGYSLSLMECNLYYAETELILIDPEKKYLELLEYVDIYATIESNGPVVIHRITEDTISLKEEPYQLSSLRIRP